MYSNQHAAALLLAFTPDQRRSIYHLIRSSSDPERDVGAAQAAAPAAIPIFRLVDVGDLISAEAIGNWQAGMSTMFGSLFTKVWTIDDLRQIIEKGARIKGDYASQIAERVASPDTDLTDFAYKLLDTVADLPFVPSRLKSFAPGLGAAFSFLYSSLGSKDFAGDNSATMLRLGKELNGLAVETLLTAAEISYESRVSPKTLDSFGSTMQNIWQWLWGQGGGASPLGLPSKTEGGDIEMGDVDAFGDIQRAARHLASAYEEGDPDAAAELGFIAEGAGLALKGIGAIGKAIGKGIRKKKAKRRARHKAAPRQHKAMVGQMRDQIASMGLDPTKKQDVALGVSRLMGNSGVPAGAHSGTFSQDESPGMYDDGGEQVEDEEYPDGVSETGSPCEGGDPEDGDPNDNE